MQKKILLREHCLFIPVKLFIKAATRKSLCWTPALKIGKNTKLRRKSFEKLLKNANFCAKSF